MGGKRYTKAPAHLRPYLRGVAKWRSNTKKTKGKLPRKLESASRYNEMMTYIAPYVKRYKKGPKAAKVAVSGETKGQRALRRWREAKKRAGITGQSPRKFSSGYNKIMNIYKGMSNSK